MLHYMFSYTRLNVPLQQVLKGKKFTEAAKILTPSLKGETNDVIAYDYTSVSATYMVPYGSTVDRYVYVNFLRKILRPKVRQTHSQMLNRVIILHDNPC